MNRKERFAKIHAVIVAGRELVDDKTASLAPMLYGTMKYEKVQDNSNPELIKAGTRINWKGTLKKAAVDLWDTEANNPENAPTLWADLDYKDGHRIIPEVITVTTMFAKDEYGWWNNLLYKSLMDANVYTPEAYPAGWELVEGQQQAEVVEVIPEEEEENTIL